MPHLNLLVVADLHYVGKARHECSIPQRKARMGRELLERAIVRAKREFQPDAVVLMGDLVDNGLAEGAKEDLADLKQTLNAHGLRAIVVPGNHDASAERLLEVFEDRPGIHEVGGCRLVSFAERYNSDDSAARDPESLRALSSGEGPLLVFQHNPVYPPIESNYPFNLTNAAEVMEAYREAGVLLSVSGHYHRGHSVVYDNSVGYVICPALCEEPFGYLQIEVRDESVQVREHQLKLPANPPIIDCHSHTSFAYCAEDIDVQPALERAHLFGMTMQNITEHSPHLYATWEQRNSRNSIDDPSLARRNREAGIDRMRTYRALMEPVRSDFTLLGLEVECNRNGDLILLEEDAEGWDYLVGAVHELPSDRPQSSPEEVAQSFMWASERLLRHGVSVLAHPFRYFRRHRMQTPTALFQPMARLLAETGVAAEINYHTNQPEPEFFRMCLEAGVKIAFGSDAHALREVGDFGSHLRFLREVAGTDDLSGILWTPPATRWSPVSRP